MTYAACGIALDSAVSLPELAKVDQPEADCRFVLRPEQGQICEPDSWIVERRLDDGRPWLSIAKTSAGYLLRFPGLGDFLVTDGGRVISCAPEPKTPIRTIRHLLLDQVLPLVLSAFGRLVLHAGAVEVEAGALLFLGASGAGKSTLVGALCQRGARLLADDCVVVDIEDGHALAVPSYAGLRLWPSSVTALYQDGAESREVAHYTEKRRVASSDGRLPHAFRAVPIAGMYVLDPIDPDDQAHDSNIGSATVVRLGGRDACMTLIKSAFQLDVTDPAATCRSFQQVGHLASICSISRLQYPREFSHLPAVVDAVLTQHHE